MGSSQLIPPLPEGFKLDIPPLPPGFTLDSEHQTFTGEASPEVMSAHKPAPYTPPQLPGASAVLGPETYFGRQMAGQREGLQNAPLVDLTTLTPDPGYARGAARFASGLTTPTNLALAGGMGMLGAAPAAMKLPQIAAGIFTVDMAKSAYDRYPEFKAAVDAGNIPKAKEIGTELVLTGALAGLTGAHALRGPRGLLKGETYDTQNVQGIPSEVGVREEPVQAQPIESTGREATPAGGVLQAQREVVPPLPEGFKLDVPAEVPSAQPVLQLQPTAELRGRPGGNTGNRGTARQPAKSLLPEPQTPEDRAIRDFAIQRVNELADEFSQGFPTKEKGNVITGKETYRRWEGRNIEDIPVAADVYHQYRHGPEAIANALKKRSGKIWDRLVQKAEEYERIKPKGEAYEGPTAFGGEADVSFNPAEFETPAPTIADLSKQMAKAGEQARGQAANEIIGQLGEKALGRPKQAGSLEGSPLFPKAEEPNLFTGGPEAGSLPIFKDVEQMPLPKYAGSINLERVGADYPVKKLIRDVYDQYKGKINEARREVITLEETKKLADELGMTEKQLLKRKVGKAFNAEEVTAARDILNASAQRLDLLKQQWAKSGSEDAVAEFRKAMDLHAEIQAEVSGVATEAGRALGAHRIISEPAKGYKKMLDALGGRELNEEILKQFSQIDASDPRQVNAFVRAYSKATIWDQFYEAWRSMGLLSGPVTHIVNTASNLLTLSTRIPETLIGAGVERLRSREPQAFAGEVREEVFGALAGIKPGMKAALAAWNEEMPLSEARFETHRRYIPGKLGKNIRIPYRLLSAADEMLKSVNYSAEAYQLAYRKARLSGAKTKQEIAEQIPTHLADKDIIDKANKAAMYWTFNQPLGPWSMKVEQLRTIIPGARYIIPFLRTSTNIAKFGLERTPLNFARLMRDYRRGNLKGVELSEELAKPILGSMIGAATVMLAAEGYITGAGPKNQNERETLLRSGWRPYSFKIGETYYPYGRLEPIGSVVGMAADFAEARGLEKPSQVASKIAQSISKNLTSKTFMQGLASLNDAISDPERFGQKFLKSYAGTLVPNIVATVARSTDPYQRITEGPMQAIQSRIPLWSERLPPKRDVLGRPIEKQGQIPISRKSDEFIDNELVRVKAWIGDLDKKEMTTQQFDEYAQRVGKALRPRLEIILHSSMPDDIKREQAKRAASDARSQVRRLMAIPAKPR